MINNIFNNYEGSSNGFVSTLDSYSINDLVNLYITYSRTKYFIENDNMEEILKYISTYIVKNLSKLSFLEIMDLHSKMMLETIDVEKMMKSNKNIVNIRTSNLEDDFFLEMEAKTFNMDKDSFERKYRDEINYFKKNDGIYETIYKLLDKFQKDIFIYLNNYANELSVTDRNELLIEINKTIEKNSSEIIKRIEFRQDKKKIEIHSKFRDLPMAEIYEKLDPTFLEQQNYVYLNFQSVLSDLNKGNSK